MRTCLLIALAWIAGHLSAAQVAVGDTLLTIPPDEVHQELDQTSKLLTTIRSMLPPEYRVLYAEAPAVEVAKANAGENVAVSTYQVLMSMGELDTSSFTREDFLTARTDLVDGLKEGLEEATIDESVDLVRRTIAQQTQSQVTIDKPTLVGEPEVTDDHVRFTMLIVVTLNNQKRIQAVRGTMRPIKNKLVLLFSYREVSSEDSIERVRNTHAAFVDRIVRANSLVLPGDLSAPVEDLSAEPKPTSERTKPPATKPAAAAIIP